MGKNPNIITDRQHPFKRIVHIGSAIFLGAVCLGVTTQPTPICASETEKDKASLGSVNKEDGSKSQIQSAATNSAISFEKFIEGMRCSGCGKHCLLTALKCPMGDEALKKAKEEYQKIKNKSVATLTISVPETEISDNLASILDIAPLGGLAAGGIYMALERNKERIDKK